MQRQTCDSTGRQDAIQIAVEDPPASKRLFEGNTQPKIRTAASKEFAFLPGGKLDRRSKRQGGHYGRFVEELVFELDHAVAQAEGAIRSIDDLLSIARDVVGVADVAERATGRRKASRR